MNVIKLLLLPFAALYNLVMRLRNYLYDIGHKPSFQFDIPIITVGNLNAGGSGKTPMIEYLIVLLKEKFSLATLSRGFGRDTQGYRVAGESDSARSMGDEPFQLFRKFGNEINVMVGEDRVLAIPTILQEFPETEVILLDDALQHRSVKAQLTILVTEYSNPFYRDFVIPSGRLRESRGGASRADIIVVTKCSDQLSREERNGITHDIERYAGQKPVFFSMIQYQTPLAMGTQSAWSDNLVLVSGIAKAQSILSLCSSKYNVLKHFDFPDHHRYSADDLQRIENFCKGISGPFSIVTTEKDMVKLIGPELRVFLDRQPWFYIPIRHTFLQDGTQFDDLVRNAVANTGKH